jgi:hypothetical protein
MDAKEGDYERKEFCGHIIRQRVTDGYLNATNMCKINGKRLNDYYRLEQTQEYLNELSSDTGYPVTVLMEVKRGGNPKEQGTWVHPNVAIHLAQWLSPKFSVAVSKWVHRFMYGDLTLIEEIKQNNIAMQKQLEESKLQIAHLEKRQMKLESFVKNIKQLEKNQLFYIATTRNYAMNNRYEYGGVKDIKELRGRFATYNTGRAEGDLMYVAKLFRCNSYRSIEERVNAVLMQFKDKPNSRKEMVHLRYNLLIEVVEFICDNYDREVDYINTHCQRFLTETIESDSIIPDEYKEDYLQLTVRKNGKERINRIDISNWDDEKINRTIEQIINLCASEQKQIRYDFSTQKDSVPLDLTWRLLSPYLELYNGLTKTDWRNKFKSWYNKEKPNRLKIKGLKMAP